MVVCVVEPRNLELSRDSPFCGSRDQLGQVRSQLVHAQPKGWYLTWRTCRHLCRDFRCTLTFRGVSCIIQVDNAGDDGQRNGYRWLVQGPMATTWTELANQLGVTSCRGSSSSLFYVQDNSFRPERIKAHYGIHFFADSPFFAPYSTVPYF